MLWMGHESGAICSKSLLPHNLPSLGSHMIDAVPKPRDLPVGTLEGGLPPLPADHVGESHEVRGGDSRPARSCYLEETSPTGHLSSKPLEEGGQGVLGHRGVADTGQDIGGVLGGEWMRGTAPGWHG